MLYFYLKRFALCNCLIIISTSCYGYNNNNIITHYEERDLKLFNSHDGNHPGIFTFIDNTLTLYGKEALRNLIKQPIQDIDKLTARQEIIQQLNDDPDLFNNINQELINFKNNEQEFSNFWQPKDAICTTARQEFYYNNRFLQKYNTSPIMLAAGQVAHIFGLSEPLLHHLLIHGLMHFVFNSKSSNSCCGNNPQHEHTHANKKHKSENTNAGCCNNSVEPEHSHANKEHHCPTEDARTKIAYKAYSAIHTFTHFLSLKTLIEHIKQKSDIIKHMQQELICVNMCITSLKNIFKILKSNNILNNNLIYLDNLSFNNSSLKLQKLLSLLEKNTFLGTPSYFSNTANVLAAYQLMNEVKQELYPSLKALAEIDQYMSITKLYIKYKNSPVKYSFANYKTDNKPFVELKNFWNPFISINNVTAKTISLGTNNNPLNIIIRGPNQSGKSTDLSAIALNILFAQTLSIVPAEYISFTPFNKIITLIVSSDNITTGNSLFTSELVRADEMLNYLNNSDGLNFIAIDEFFRTTDFERGQKAAYKFANYLGQFKNNISIISTHFPKLSDLEKDQPDNFKNYKAQMTIDNSGHKHYSLVEGISDQSEIFDVIKQNGIDSFLLD